MEDRQITFFTCKAEDNGWMDGWIHALHGSSYLAEELIAAQATEPGYPRNLLGTAHFPRF